MLCSFVSLWECDLSSQFLSWCSQICKCLGVKASLFFSLSSWPLVTVFAFTHRPDGHTGAQRQTLFLIFHVLGLWRHYFMISSVVLPRNLYIFNCSFMSKYETIKFCHFLSISLISLSLYFYYEVTILIWNIACIVFEKWCSNQWASSQTRTRKSKCSWGLPQPRPSSKALSLSESLCSKFRTLRSSPSWNSVSTVWMGRKRGAITSCKPQPHGGTLVTERETGCFWCISFSPKESVAGLC